MKKNSFFLCIIAMSMIVLFGCDKRLSLNGIGNTEAFNDAQKIIQQDYPNVKIISNVDDVNIENISNDNGERHMAVVMIVEENGRKQAILIELVYSGKYYGDSTQYRIVSKNDVVGDN